MKRLGYIEWMQKIHNVHQAPSQLARGLDRLLNSEPPQLPPGVSQPLNQ